MSNTPSEIGQREEGELSDDDELFDFETLKLIGPTTGGGGVDYQLISRHPLGVSYSSNNQPQKSRSLVSPLQSSRHYHENYDTHFSSSRSMDQQRYSSSHHSSASRSGGGRTTTGGFWSRYQSSLSSWSERYCHGNERRRDENKRVRSRSPIHRSSSSSSCNTTQITDSTGKEFAENMSGVIKQSRSHHSSESHGSKKDRDTIKQEIEECRIKYRNIEKQLEDLDERVKMKQQLLDDQSPLEINPMKPIDRQTANSQVIVEDEPDELELRRRALASAVNAQINDESSCSPVPCTNSTSDASIKQTTSERTNGNVSNNVKLIIEKKNQILPRNKNFLDTPEAVAHKSMIDLTSEQTQIMPVKTTLFKPKQVMSPVSTLTGVADVVPFLDTSFQSLLKTSPAKVRRNRRRKGRRNRAKKLLESKPTGSIFRPGVIRNVLSIESPDQQVEQFLKLVGNKQNKQSQQGSIHDVLTLKNEDDRINKFIQHVASSAKKKKPGRQITGQMQDNYEVEEMDLDSEVDESNTGIQFIDSIPPRMQYKYDPSAVDYDASENNLEYDPAISLGYDPMHYTGNTAHHLSSYRYITPGEILLPHELQAPPPPPPPDSDSPPPLPDEPPPVEDTPIPPPESLPEDKQDDDDDEDDDDDAVPDEDAELLRAQLLQSVTDKRRKKLNHPDEIRESSPMTPLTSRSQSPAVQQTDQSPLNISTKKHSKRVVMPSIDLPGKFIIRIGSSESETDEEEEEEETEIQEEKHPLTSIPPTKNLAFSINLDRFLREQRNTSEVQTIEKPTESKPATLIKTKTKKPKKKISVDDFKKMEEKVHRERALLATDQNKLKKERLLFVNKARLLQGAEKRVEKLKEMLMTAEKNVKDIREHKTKLANTVNILVRRTKGRESNLSVLDAQLKTIGRRIFGEKYKPKWLIEHEKKSVQETQEQSSSTVSLDEEKQRLLTLQKQLADKIKEYRLQENKTASTENRQQHHRKSVHIAAVVAQPMVIDNGDKIDLPHVNETEIEMSRFDETNRKHSILELNTSTKPEFVDNETQQQQQQRVENHSPTDNQEKTIDTIEEKTPELMKKITKLQNAASKLNSIVARSGWSPTYKLQQQQFKQPKLMNVRVTDRNSATGNSEVQTKAFQPYTSMLTSFKGYRLGRFYRTREKLPLNSKTYANKIDPKKLVCRFDLMGKCNDDSCQWQHSKDYTMTDSEILQDILSYCPAEAGVTPESTAEEIPSIIEKYTNELLSNSKINFDKLCFLLVTRVNARLDKKHPYYVPNEARKWNPKPTVESKWTITSVENDHQTSVEPSIEKETTKTEWLNRLTVSDLDDMICEQDLRYFIRAGDTVETMEEAVLDDPHNTSLWIKLAYHKLHDAYSEPGVALDHALNVMSRALEKHRRCKDLWLHYLSLYEKRSELSDLCDLFEMAVRYAAHYDIWWKYLKIVKTYSEKEAVCNRILTWLSTQSITDDNSSTQISHHTLEIVFYLVNLNSITGRFRPAGQVLQAVLKGKPVGSVNVHQILTDSDLCKLHLAYIHMLEFRQLPDEWFINKPGRLVLKELPVFVWDTKIRSNSEVLIKLLQAAMKSFKSDCKMTEISLCLRENLTNLQTALNKTEIAKEQCRELLKNNPDCAELWMQLACIYLRDENVSGAVEVFVEAVKLNPHSPELCFKLAQTLRNQNDRVGASQLLCKYVNRMFVLSAAADTKPTPTQLYRLLLGQSISVLTQIPTIVSTIDLRKLKEKQVYIWLNYCLLLELRGDHKQTCEMYETAQCVLRKTEDVQRVWVSYLQYRLNFVSIESDVKLQQKEFRFLLELIQRCLVSMPSQFPVPDHPQQYYTDYSFHNQVALLVLDSLTDVEEQEKLFDRYLNVMSSNTQLLKRAVSHSISCSNIPRARILTLSAVHSHQTPVISLWKSAIAICLQEGNFKEARNVYKQAVKQMPYEVTLWKDFILFEFVRGSSTDAQILINEATKLGLNLQEFLQTISHA